MHFITTKKVKSMKNYKTYKRYKAQEDFLMNFQMCRAFLNTNCGVTRIVENILSRRFRDDISIVDMYNYRHFLNAINETKGKRTEIVHLPRLRFRDSVENILSEFVRVNFDKMVESVNESLGRYPLKFRDIVEEDHNS